MSLGECNRSAGTYISVLAAALNVHPNLEQPWRLLNRLYDEALSSTACRAVVLLRGLATLMYGQNFSYLLPAGKAMRHVLGTQVRSSRRVDFDWTSDILGFI